MEDRSFRPWLLTLLLSIGVAVALVLFTNLSGGYANAPWFLSLGVGVGATLACLWLIGNQIVRWRWQEEDDPPSQKTVGLDEPVRTYSAMLSRPAQLTPNLHPMLHAVLDDRLRRFHAVDLDAEPDRARAVTPTALYQVATGGQPIWPAQLGSVLDELDSLVPRTDPHPRPEGLT